MSYFYTAARHSHGPIIQQTDRDKGITTYTASWQGAVQVHLYFNEATGLDMARVTLKRWHDNAAAEVLYEGTVGSSMVDEEHGHG